MENILKWMRHYISPVFLALLLASFILWYIAKLSYTYTTEQVMQVDVDGRELEVKCVVEGVGTNLFGYQVYMDRCLSIPLSKLRYTKVDLSAENHPEYETLDPQREWIEIDPQSMKDAISVQCSDIKILAAEIPLVEKPEVKETEQKQERKKK